MRACQVPQHGPVTETLDQISDHDPNQVRVTIKDVKLKLAKPPFSPTSARALHELGRHNRPSARRGSVLPNHPVRPVKAWLRDSPTEPSYLLKTDWWTSSALRLPRQYEHPEDHVPAPADKHGHLPSSTPLMVS